VRTKLLIAILVCSLAGTATAPGREPIRKGDVAAVPLRGEVAPSMLAFLRRAVKTAESNEASAIVFEMNTYGGRLDTAADIKPRYPLTLSSTQTLDRPARLSQSPRSTFLWRR